MEAGQGRSRTSSRRRAVKPAQVRGFLGDLVDITFRHFGAHVDPQLRGMLEELARRAGERLSQVNADAAAEVDPYLLLGVEPTSTWDQIKARWRTLVKIAHPDKGGDANLFELMHAAYLELEKRHKP